MAECEQPAVALAAGEAQPSPEVRLADAMATHQAGKLAEAELAYRALLAEFPDDTNATHLLGVVRFQSGAPAEGLQLVQRSLEADPANAHAWNNLGNMYVYLKRKEEAEAAYRRATTLDGAAAPALYNLGLACLRRNELEQGLTHLRAATRARPRFVDALHTLTLLYYRLGRPQEACDVYRQWAEEDPGNPTPRHMLAASSGRDVPERCEEGHIVRMFDNFADEFEEKLRQLDYCGPQLVAMCLVHHPLYQSGRAAILDAGCGTGWCGPLLKSTAGRLVGVDLSPKMLERARSRGVYDELHEGELTAFMSSHPGVVRCHRVRRRAHLLRQTGRAAARRARRAATGRSAVLFRGSAARAGVGRGLSAAGAWPLHALARVPRAGTGHCGLPGAADL